MKRIYVVATIYSLILIGLHCFSFVFPPKYSWGFYHFDYFPSSYRVIAGVLAVTLCLPFINERLAVYSTKVFSIGKGSRWVRAKPVYLVTSIACLFLLWYFRSGNYFLGDTTLLASIISDAEWTKKFMGVHTETFVGARAPLDIWLHHLAYRLFNRLWDTGAYDVYAVLSCLSGGFFIFLVLTLSSHLFEDRYHSALLSCIVLSTGAMQLFFGYVESYTLLPTGLILYVLTSYYYLNNRCTIAIPAVILGTCILLHISSACLLVSLLYLSTVKESDGLKKIKKLLWPTGFFFLLPFLLFFLLLIGLGFSLQSHLRPPITNLVPLAGVQGPLERYTMFSLAHLNDIVNEQLLVSPFGLFLIVATILFLRNDLSIREPFTMFLSIAGALYLVTILIANPELGGRKDWDAFATPSLLYTLLAGIMVLRAARGNNYVHRLLVMVVGISLLHSVPWVLSNAKVDFSEYMTARKAGTQHLINGSSEKALAQYESALAILLSPELAEQTGSIYLSLGRFEEAEQKLSQAIRYEDNRETAYYTSLNARLLLAYTYLQMDRADDAIEQLNALIRLDEEQNLGFEKRSSAHLYMGMAYIAKGMRLQAVRELRTALDLDAQNIQARRLLLSIVSQ